MGQVKMNFHGDPNIGLYGFATDKYCLVGTNVKKVLQKLASALEVPVYFVDLFDSELIKIFIAGNSNNIVAPDFVPDDDVAHLRKITKLKVHVLKTYYALGNLILMNDKGMVISPLIRNLREHLASKFNLDCKVSTIAGLNTVGTLGIATNKGCLVHPKIKPSELEIIENTLQVNVDVGTVGFGSPHLGAGVIANSHGFAANDRGSGIELGRIAEALGFV